MKTRHCLRTYTSSRKYGLRRIVTELSMINCKREELDTYLKSIREAGSTDHRRKSGRSMHARTVKKVTTVNEPRGLLSQEGQKQTHRSARQISRETGLTQCSIIQIIHRDLSQKCLSFTNTLIIVGIFFYIF